MRVPPDILATLIKLKDFIVFFGPALLAAITLKATLLTALDTDTNPKLLSGSIRLRWLWWLKAFLEAGTPQPLTPLTLLRTHLGRRSLPQAPIQPNPTNPGFQAAAISTSLAGLLTALVLSPVVLVIRLIAGVGIGFLLFTVNINPNRSRAAVTAKDLLKRPLTLTSTQSSPSETDSSTSPGPSSFLQRFGKNWLAEADPYSSAGFYNFVLAAIFTIFVPSRLVENALGTSQWSGPLLAPLLGLLLAPVGGTEIAMVLALSIKGASTGSWVAALIAFPLITLMGIASKWQDYGTQQTVSYALVVWTVAGSVGLLVNLLGINIYV